jgi:hypothetical protein
MPDTPSPSFSPRRKWQTVAHVIGSTLALAAVLLMANYLAARHPRRFQWSADPRFLLSPVTKDVLRSVTNQVKVIVFFDRTKPLYDMVSDLLAEYRAYCPRMQLEFVDYERSPARARLVQAEYGLAAAGDGDRVIFDSGTKRAIVYARDLSEFDYNAVLRGQEVKRTGFKGEQLFTSAVFTLIDNRSSRVYFLQGHGEHDPTDEDDSGGYTRFARVLQESQITVSKLEPAALLNGEIPGDCQLLVVANPVRSLAPAELEKMDKYLNQGGRLLVLFSVDSIKEPTGLEKWLTRWGVEVGRNVVYEAPQGKPNDVRQLIVTHFGNHPIVAPLGRSRLLLIVPRSIAPHVKTPQSADAPKPVELATTGADGMAVQPGGRVERQNAAIPVMVAVEKGAIQGISADRGAARLVVVGDSYCLANTAIEVAGNRDFARNAANWLLSRDLLVQGIATRSIKEYRITMTSGEMTAVRWLFLGGFPGSVLVVGLFVWIRRRT